MYLTHLTLTNFRSFYRLDMELPRRILLLVGDNAQGKTSLLEALFYFSTFSSIQASNDRQIINFQQLEEKLAVSRLVATFERKDGLHEIEIRLILEQNGTNGNSRLRKEILVDGVRRSAHQAVGMFNAVIFLPQMTRIIEGGPEERRRYLNLALAQTIPGYARALSEYAQALSQRNALLKMLADRSGDISQLDYWDELLSKRGAMLIYHRSSAVEELKKEASAIHRGLTQNQEILNLDYRPAYDPIPQNNNQLELPLQTTLTRSNISLTEIENGFREALIQKRREEIARGVTTIGPHRDELRLLANQVDLGDYGSRGQIRTALLSLKLAEIEWMHTKTGEYPVLLLDETLAELDIQRRADLLTVLARAEQAILTTTDLHLFDEEFVKKAATWQIEGGMVTDTTTEGQPLN